MHKQAFSKAAPRVVCAFVVLFVSSGTFGQVQRRPADAVPQSRRSDARLAPYTAADPSAINGSERGSDGTTPILHESAKLTASDGDADDRFGRSVSMDGDTAVVGAPLVDCAAGERCGAAYAYRFNGSDWVEEQKLTASDAAAGDWFGISVSVSGDTVLMGAGADDCASGGGCGSAYVFRFNGSSWAEEQKLTAADARVGDHFGWSVSVSGDTALVGAHFDDCAAGLNCGSAYVFRFDGTSWVQEQKLAASDAGARDGFGFSVSVSGDTAIVGAVQDDGAAGIDCGSAYVFRFSRTSWVEDQKLTASDAAAGDAFGTSVSVRGDTAVVGTYLDQCAAGSERGSAYLFRFNGTDWVEGQKLTASDAAPGDWFGISVSVSGVAVAVGAFRDDCAMGASCGSAYVYRFNGTGWVEENKLTAFDAGARDGFGVSVSVSGETAVVGAWRDDCPAGGACGAAYVFNLDELQVTIDIKPGSDANPVNLSSPGVLPVAVLTTSVADGDLVDFDAANVDPLSLTLAGAAPQTKGRRSRTGTLEDIDGDGDLDLVVHFPIAELDLTEQDTEAVLLGQTLVGTRIRGIDTIKAFRIYRFRVDDVRDGE